MKEPIVPVEVAGTDISKYPAEKLISLARNATKLKVYEYARIYSYWASKSLPQELYDLACNSALAGDKEGAFYWLQQSAISVGVDFDWAMDDSDLLSLRQDPCWTEFSKWLLNCQKYHRKNSKPITTLVLPTGYDPKKGQPLNVVVWLHGMGSHPDDFVDPKAEGSLAKNFADDLNMAFVGVSGTTIKSKVKFNWAENAIADMERVSLALDEIKDKVQIKAGGLIAFGFSQGGQVGLELAARHPDMFAGAIVLSPGSEIVTLQRIGTPDPLLKKRGFVFCCGAREHPGNIAQTENGVRWTQNAGAKVRKILTPGQSAHSFPPDFEEQFPEWIKFIFVANNAK